MATPNKMYDTTDDNGCVFLDKYYIPEEVLSIILSYVPEKDLVFSCRSVCKYWCNVIDSQVWRNKFRQRNLPVSKVKEIPWFACYWILQKNPFQRNLIKNSCGQDGLKHWRLVTNQLWAVEKFPQGCAGFPEDCDNEMKKFSSCFASSYVSCSKEQVVDLQQEGAVPQIMDILHPKITVSEWYCGRSDCGSLYEFKAGILDKYKNLIDEYTFNKKLEMPEGASWKKVSHTFENYGKGVRYVWLYHYGRDSLYWKGHFGSKITGSSVVLSLPL